jgi:hypothetical protein
MSSQVEEGTGSCIDEVGEDGDGGGDGVGSRGGSVGGMRCGGNVSCDVGSGSGASLVWVGLRLRWVLYILEGDLALHM